MSTSFEIPQQPQDAQAEIALKGFSEWYGRMSAHYLSASDADPRDHATLFEARTTLDAMADAEPELMQQMLASRRADLWTRRDNSLKQVG
jgi:hypothetical protein